MGYVEEPDGTRVYDKGRRYKPVPLEERKYRKFPKGTIWHGGQPFGPLPLLPDEKRRLPATVPDAETKTHQLGCLCWYCQFEVVRRKKRDYLLRRE